MSTVHHRVAITSGVLFAALLVLCSFYVEFPTGPLVGAGVVLATAAWAVRSQTGLIALAGLITVNLVFILFPFGGLAEIVNPESLGAVLSNLGLLVIGATGAVSAAVAVRQRGTRPAVIR
jgi:hypothetical protein